MDKIRIKDMQVFARHGALPEENVLGQRFIISLELSLNLREVGETDDLTKGVSYADVYLRVEEIATKNTFKLIETLGETIARSVIEEFPVEGVVVGIKKPAAPIPGIFDYVEIEVSRTRSDYSQKGELEPSDYEHLY